MFRLFLLTMLMGLVWVGNQTSADQPFRDRSEQTLFAFVSETFSVLPK